MDDAELSAWLSDVDGGGLTNDVATLIVLYARVRIRRLDETLTRVVEDLATNAYGSRLVGGRNGLLWFAEDQRYWAHGDVAQRAEQRRDPWCFSGTSAAAPWTAQPRGLPSWTDQLCVTAEGGLVVLYDDGTISENGGLARVVSVLDTLVSPASSALSACWSSALVTSATELTLAYLRMLRERRDEQRGKNATAAVEEKSSVISGISGGRTKLAATATAFHMLIGFCGNVLLSVDRATLALLGAFIVRGPPDRGRSLYRASTPDSLWLFHRDRHEDTDVGQRLHVPDGKATGVDAHQGRAPRVPRARPGE